MEEMQLMLVRKEHSSSPSLANSLRKLKYSVRYLLCGRTPCSICTHHQHSHSHAAAAAHRPPSSEPHRHPLQNPSVGTWPAAWQLHTAHERMTSGVSSDQYWETVMHYFAFVVCFSFFVTHLSYFFGHKDWNIPSSSQHMVYIYRNKKAKQALILHSL